MSFSADWLSLRSPADLRARDAGLVERLTNALGRSALRVLDLGSGTGANMKALAPTLQQAQHWVLTDNDPELLSLVDASDGVTCDHVPIDIAGDLSALFDPAPDLVTASAFFDLCGARIIDRIVADTVATQAVFYTVLTYDGREVWSPLHPLDAEVLAAFHADQQTDKGLGPALGPDATDYLADQFRKAGYHVHTAPSDWQLEHPRDATLIQTLAEGSAAAVQTRIGTDSTATWRGARTGATNVMIGHQDLLALPR